MKISFFSLVFVILFAGTTYAEPISMKCTSRLIITSENGIKKNLTPGNSSVFKIFLNDNYFERDELKSKTFFIQKNDKILWYELSGRGLSFSSIDRYTGEFKYKGILNIKEVDYINVKTLLDEINSSIVGYEKDILWGKDYYKIGKYPIKSKELEKFNIIREAFLNKKYSYDYYEGFWDCVKVDKIF